MDAIRILVVMKQIIQEIFTPYIAKQGFIDLPKATDLERTSAFSTARVEVMTISGKSMAARSVGFKLGDVKKLLTRQTKKTNNNRIFIFISSIRFHQSLFQ
ncbi:MAG: hypothetical protein NVS1B13_23760 [Flavisolibacter sp.]